MILDHGVRERRLGWNPARQALLPQEKDIAPKTAKRSLTLSEFEAVLAECQHHRLGAAVAVAVTLGLRPGEIRGLLWQNIDFGAGTVAVTGSLKDGPGGPKLGGTKTGKMRTLLAPARLIEHLRRHRAAQAAERLAAAELWPDQWGQLVFRSEVGTPIDPSNMRRLVREIQRTAGINDPVTPNELRHTAGSLLIDAGVRDQRVADLLGHDVRTLHAHYRHVVRPTEDAAREFDRIIAAAD